MRHEGSVSYFRALGLVLAAAYLSFIGWLMVRSHDVAWVPAPNLRPFDTIRADLAMGAFQAVRRIGEGLLLLAPLGVLLPMAGGRLRVSGPGSFVRTVFAGLMVSLMVECLQTVVPGQIFDVDALLLNTAGVAVAYLVVVPTARRRLRRRGFVGPEDTRYHREMRGSEHVRGGGGIRGTQGSSRTVTRVGIAP